MLKLKLSSISNKLILFQTSYKLNIHFYCIVITYIFKWSWIFILKWLVLNISDPTRKFATCCCYICKKMQYFVSKHINKNEPSYWDELSSPSENMKCKVQYLKALSWGWLNEQHVKHNKELEGRKNLKVIRNILNNTIYSLWQKKMYIVSYLEIDMSYQNKFLEK